MAIRVGINGFGRIGRMFYRAALNQKERSRSSPSTTSPTRPTLAHLLKYDSIHRTLRQEVKRRRRCTSSSTASRSRCSPSAIPRSSHGRISACRWSSNRPGFSPRRKRPPMHIGAGAKKVVISAPADGADVTLCMGVNHDTFDSEKHDDHFECIVHHQLPRAGREGARRYIRRSARPDDDGAFATPRIRTCRTGRIRICAAPAPPRSR